MTSGGPVRIHEQYKEAKEWNSSQKSVELSTRLTSYYDLKPGRYQLYLVVEPETPNQASRTKSPTIFFHLDFVVSNFKPIQGKPSTKYLSSPYPFETVTNKQYFLSLDQTNKRMSTPIQYDECKYLTRQEQ